MEVRVGIPRALLYHYYQPAWEVFFKALGSKVIISPETNKKILDQGVRVAVDDICLPFKVYFGHIIELRDRVDYLFVPRFISLGKNNYVCPKFMGLPDMLTATFNELPEMIKPVVDLRPGLRSIRKIAHQIGQKLGVGYFRIERAFRQAVQQHLEFSIEQQKAFTGGSDGSLRVAILGHAYLTYDKLTSMDIAGHLSKMGVNVITLEMIAPALLEKAATRQPKKLFWIYNRQVMGAAYHLLFEQEGQIDGIIQLTAFGCGPDSMIKELINIRGKKMGVAILDINIDEHSGQAGLITRLEAFIDLLERKVLA